MHHKIKLIYNTEDGRSQIKLRTDQNTVWLSQREMAELLDGSVDNIGLHLKNMYKDGELIREATAEDSSVVQNRGNLQSPTIPHALQPGRHSGRGIPGALAVAT
jgi:hypothetical protein